MASTFKAVGFIGLGLMGKPMAGHLATKLPLETRIFIYDVAQEPVQELCLEHEGTVVKCENAKDVADRSDIIFTMLPEGQHVEAVYLTADTGICSSDLSHKLLVDCSTIDTATSLAVKAHITTHHPTATFYDAPVSGGVLGAHAATIAFFLGCAPSDPHLPTLSPLLHLMGARVIPCGGPALGLAAKLSNNYLSGVVAIASAEALDMGMRAGLDPRVLASVFAAGTAQNTICDRFCPCPGVVADAPSSMGYRGGFKVQLMRKDFALAVEMAERVGARNVLGEVGLDTYTRAMNDPRCKDLDSRVVYRYLGGDEEWEGREEVEGDRKKDRKKDRE